eukprot:scaffold50164_cov42-Phaeocystis_antarctica.AAC.1
MPTSAADVPGLHTVWAVLPARGLGRGSAACGRVAAGGGDGTLGLAREIGGRGVGASLAR